MDAALRSRIVRRTAMALGSWSLVMVLVVGILVYANNTTSAEPEAKTPGASAARPSVKRNQSTP